MADLGAVIRFQTKIEGAQAVASYGKSLDAVKGQVLALGAAYLSVAGAQKAWDIAKQGAAVNQTRESFERMNAEVFKTPDLLAQMTSASRRTIGELQLMQGLLKLTAGASTDLAQQFAQAAPQLLEIAKASNKLNPALGDTAFLYDSIATGIKRSSPLILDNLGIVVKVGEANEKYAASLGKSVEALTAEEKQIALLNATLEAGGRLIDQVGGNVDSATDAYAQLEVAISGAFNTFKSAVATGAAEQMGDLASGTDNAAAAFDRLAQSAGTALGVILGSAADAAGQIERIAVIGQMEQAAGQLEGLDPEAARRIYNESLGIYFDALRTAATTGTTLADAMFGANLEILDRYQTAIGEASFATLDLANQMDPAGRRAARAAAEGHGQLADSLREAAVAAGNAASEFAGLDLESLAEMSQADIWREAGDAIGEMWEEGKEKQIDALRELRDETQDILADLIQEYREYGQAGGDAFTALSQQLRSGDLREALVSPTRTVSFITGGPTAEQNALMREYQELYGRAAEKARDLSFGIGTVGDTQEEVNEQIGKANAEMAHYQALMDGMALPTTTYGQRVEQFAVNLDVATQALYDHVDAAGATAPALADLSVRMGLLDQATADATAKGVLLDQAFAVLAEGFVAGEIDAAGLLSSYDAIIAEIEGKSLVQLQLEFGPPPPIEDIIPSDAYRVPWQDFEQYKPEAMQIDVEANTDPAFAAIEEAFNRNLGLAPEDRTADLLADLDLIDEALGEIPGKIESTDRRIVFQPVGDEVDAYIISLSGRNIQIPVEFVPTGEIPSAPPPSPVGGRASGGPVGWGHSYIVGEQGPELFVPWTGGNIIPSHKLRASGGGQQIVVQFGDMNFYGLASPQRVATAVERAADSVVRAVERAGKVA